MTSLPMAFPLLYKRIPKKQGLRPESGVDVGGGVGIKGYQKNKD